MKKLTLLLTSVLVCLISINSSAQVSLSNYSTYNLEVIPFRSDYQNVLTEKDVNLNFNNLTQVADNGDLYIRVSFISGLKSSYLLQTAIPGTGFAYRCAYIMPSYRVSIIDKNGNLILQKIYGGQKQEAVFGEYSSISSPEDLKYEWEANRVAFYQQLESSPEEPIIQEMDEELAIAVQRKAQEIATGEVQPTQSEEVQEAEEERKITHTGKPRTNIYKPNKRNPKPENKKDDPSEPKLSTTSEQIFDLNGFIEVAACSKYSYQLLNNHPTATLTVYIQRKPELDAEEVLLGPGEGKFFRGLPHKHAWIIATYLKEDFQGDQILLKEELNLLAGEDNSPRVITDLLDQYFQQIKPHIVFAPVLDNNDEVIGLESENDQWKNSLKEYLSAQTVASINKSNQTKIVELTEALLSAKALRSVSEKVEKTLDSEDDQKLIYPIIKSSKNFRNVTPLLSVEFSQSLSVIGSGINNFWDKPSNSRASISFRLPFEWQLSRRKSGSYSTVHVKASYESLTLDFNRDFQAFAIDPESAFEEPEAVIPDEQFAIQTTQLGAGLAWKLYFPLPIVEIEGGAFFSHKTRLLWGQDRGQFPRSVFSPENEIIPDVVNLSSFRPYFGAKIAVPFYFSGYKFDCDSKLSNVQIFAGFRMYPVNFVENTNYKVFIKDAALIDFIPIPLQEGQSKFLMHLTIGGAVEF